MDNNAYMGKFVKDFKESIVGDSSANTDIPPVVAFGRDGKIVVVAIADRIDRDLGLAIATIGIAGFAADEVWWSADAHMTHQENNPATGKPWGPGEMQAACDDGDACQVGVLQDCILQTHWHRSAGFRSYDNLPYDVDKSTKTVTWKEPVRLGPDAGEADGYIVDVIKNAFEQPPARLNLIAEGRLPLGGEYQAKLDIITVRYLQLRGSTILTAPELVQVAVPA